MDFILKYSQNSAIFFTRVEIFAIMPAGGRYILCWSVVTLGDIIQGCSGMDINYTVGVKCRPLKNNFTGLTKISV